MSEPSPVPASFQPLQTPGGWQLHVWDDRPYNIVGFGFGGSFLAGAAAMGLFAVVTPLWFVWGPMAAVFAGVGLIGPKVFAGRASRIDLTAPWIAIDGEKRHLNEVEEVRLLDDGVALGVQITWRDGTRWPIWGTHYSREDMEWLVERLKTFASESALSREELEAVEEANERVDRMVREKARD